MEGIEVKLMRRDCTNSLLTLGLISTITSFAWSVDLTASERVRIPWTESRLVGYPTLLCRIE